MLIYEKIPLIMGEIKEIGKDRTNSMQKYNFRGIEDLYNNLKPIMAKYGVFCVPQVIESQYQQFEKETFDSFKKEKKIQINYRTIHKVNHKFYATDGSFIEVITCGEGIDQSDKSSNKALSSAMKYAFIELFSVPTEDISDGDNDHIVNEKIEKKVVDIKSKKESKNLESFDDFLG